VVCILILASASARMIDYRQRGFVQGHVTSLVTVKDIVTIED